MDRIIEIKRSINKRYSDLEWPAEIKQICFITEIKGGMGDISAAAKIIDIIKNMYSNIKIDWIISGGANKAIVHIDALSFISDLNGIRLDPHKPNDADLLIIGPSNCIWGTKYIESKFKVKINGIRFAFLEGGTEQNDDIFYGAYKLPTYEKVHKHIFPSVHRQSDGLIMGLGNGMGMVFSMDIINCKRGTDELLNGMDDICLRNDIQAYYIEKEWSINSGYAHRPNSWAKFIDCVAIHEKYLNIIVVLNCRGEFDYFDDDKFTDKILNQNRLNKLANMGYGEILLNNKLINRSNYSSCSSYSRKLVIITRPKFSFNDMKIIQLVSSRLMATGNNSASESISAGARPTMPLKLYLYEDVANCGVTDKFAEQQIKISKNIYEPFSELLELFAFEYNEFNCSKMDRINEILSDDKLEIYVYQFCKKIIDNYSFTEIFKESLLRAIWHYVDPQLLQNEISSISEKQREYIIKIINENKIA